MPPVPAAGVPDKVAVPLPLSTKLTPLGRFPVSLIAGAGVPVVVTVKLPSVPTVNVVSSADVMAGALPSAIGLLEALAAGPVPTRADRGHRHVVGVTIGQAQ